MSRLTRRRLLTGGLTTVAGASGIALAARVADHYGLIAPDHGGLYGPGETLTYAAQRLLTANANAREFSRDQISAKPFANGKPFSNAAYEKLKANAFTDWSLKVDGLVDRPGSFSLADLRQMPLRNQITHLACEEGWSFIAEWSGVPLSFLLNLVGTRPDAKWVYYGSMEPEWSDTMDMADALHPQTLITYRFNGADLPPGHGGPLRMRVPRQLGYKSVKYINRITLMDQPSKVPLQSEYSWYAGI